MNQTEPKKKTNDFFFFFLSSLVNATGYCKCGIFVRRTYFLCVRNVCVALITTTIQL